MGSPAAIIDSLAHGITSPQDLAIKQAQSGQIQQQTQNLATENQGNQLKNQLTQQAMRDNEIVKNAFVNGGADPIQYAAKNGISGQGYLGLQQHLLGIKEQYAKLNKSEQENAVAAHTQNANILMGIYQTQDPAKRAELIEQSRPLLVANESHLPDTGRHDWSSLTPDDASLKFAINANGLGGQISEQALKGAQIKKAEQDTAKAAQDTANLKAQNPGMVAESTIKQREADAMNANPLDEAKNLSQTIDPAKYPDIYKSTLGLMHGAVTLQQKQDALKTGVAQMAERQKETDPSIRAAHVQQAVDTERATSGLKIGQAVATARALRAGDNPAVAGVAPAAVAKVQSDAMKYDEEQLKANAAADSIAKVLDMAGSGNKAAGANVPMMGVGAVNAINGIKRINSAEIAQYGSAGSLLDQIQGRIGKLTAGQPIPADVLKDMKELHQMLAEGSYKHYTDSIDNLNQRTGAQYRPTVAAPAIHGTVPYQSNGRSYQIPKEQVADFLKDHPNAKPK